MAEIISCQEEENNCFSVKEVKTELNKISVSQQGDGNSCTIGDNMVFIHVQSADKDPNKISSLLSVFESHRKNRIKIGIKYNNERVTLDVHPSDTIQTTKLKLELIFGVDNKKQYLVFGEEILQNQKTIKECNIKNDDDITLFLLLQRDKILILIQRIHGRIFKLEGKPDWTIKTVKTQIEQEEGLPVNRQQLFTQSGLVMQDGEAINDYPVETTIFKLAAKAMEEDFKSIFLRGCGHHTCLQIGMYHTVNDLKRKIQKITMCPPHLQNIVFRSKILDDEKNMNDYVITKDATLHVYMRVVGGNNCAMLSVRTSIGQIFFLGLRKNYQETKIGAIKQKMHELNNSFLPEKQSLFFGNQEFDDDDKPLEYYIPMPDEEPEFEVTLDLVVKGFVI